MTTVIHARDEDAIRNGSYYRQQITTRTGGSGGGISHYMSGDFMGWVQIVPQGLKTFSLKDAKKLFPSGR